MSRITQHCACQNIRLNVCEPVKAYSFIPNYFDQPNFNQTSQPLRVDHDIYHSNKCRTCKNYENIEHFLSGPFRPQSCPIDENVNCINLPPSRERFHRKYSKSSLKQDKSKNQNKMICLTRNNNCEAGIKDHPVTSFNVSETTRMTQGHANTENNIVFIRTDIKKPSCGLKYIIFQKLSIITHFLTKSKQKKSSHSMKGRQLSEENIFNEKHSTTKRSTSFHTMEHRENLQIFENDFTRNSFTKQSKSKTHKPKGSDTSYSSTVSIDAHAGSPVTIMSRVCSKNVTVDPLFFEKNREIKNRDSQRCTPKSKGLSHSENDHQQKPSLNNSNEGQYIFCANHQNCPCPSCLFQFPQHCHPIYQPHFHRPSPVVRPFSPRHCCCCHHSHYFMPLPLSPSPTMCCDQPHHFHHFTNDMTHYHNFREQPKVYRHDDRVTLSLCNSCQTKSKNRCQSETLDDLRHGAELTTSCRPCYLASNNNVKYRLNSEVKGRISRSVASSIPPPPPPPPSSLYSATSAIQNKSKHRKHCHNKIGKLCENCSVIIPHMSHSPDCTNNVQNIIYSHLNNSVDCMDSKMDGVDQCPDQTYSYDNTTGIARKNIKYVSSKGQISMRSDKEGDKYDHQLFASKRSATDYINQNEAFDRRSADILKVNATNYKPRLYSKTPENNTSKHDRRHKRHHYDTQKISKHKSINTTREYKLIDRNLFEKDDSLDSPEAGSFIYHPISPLVHKNLQTVVPRKVSSLNNRQHCNTYNATNFGKTEFLRKAFQENMLSLKEVGWYWGPLSFIEAESLMENKANGTFLVRDSGHDTYFLSLTFRVRETTYHTRIEYSQGTFSFWSQPESHSATTIVEFIDKAVAHSQSGKFHYFLLTNVPGQPPMEVSLLYPLSRHQIVHSLKHLSRFVILSHIRKDHIMELKVPQVLRSYLMEKQYYISNLQEFIGMTQDAHPLSYQPAIFT